MTYPGPVVTVCIPAYDEVAAVGATVRSVFATAFPGECLEVIVAVDGGDAAVMQAARDAGARVVDVVPNQGSYAARNAAAALARSDATVLLFTDTDCIVSPTWIDRHLAALATADMSGGGVRFTFAGERPRPAEWVDSIRHLKQEVYVTRDHYAATCNLAVRRDVFDALRFDESLRTGGDAEFGVRATAAGKTLVYTEDAWVDHPARRTRQALLTKVRRIANGVARQRSRWVGRAYPPAKLRLGPYRSALKAGYRVGPVWGLETCLLEFRCQRMIVRAVRRALAD